MSKSENKKSEVFTKEDYNKIRKDIETTCSKQMAALEKLWAMYQEKQKESLR